MEIPPGASQVILVTAESGFTLAISARVLSCGMGAAGTTVTGDDGGNRKSGVRKRQCIPLQVKVWHFKMLQLYKQRSKIYLKYT